jgi:hypothetical protein
MDEPDSTGKLYKLLNLLKPKEARVLVLELE